VGRDTTNATIATACVCLPLDFVFQTKRNLSSF